MKYLLPLLVLASCAAPCTDNDSVMEFAQDDIRLHLKGPSTAIFHDATVEPAKQGEGKMVKGSVEAENSFGAMTTEKYYSIIRCKDGMPFVAYAAMGSNTWGSEYEAFMDSAIKAIDFMTPEQLQADV